MTRNHDSSFLVHALLAAAATMGPAYGARASQPRKPNRAFQGSKMKAREARRREQRRWR